MSEHFVHDDRFVESFANRDHWVLGKRLDPYCLWHQLNLEIIQSPVLLGEKVTPLDLWKTVRVLTTPWTPQHRIPALTPPGKFRFILEVGRFKFLEEVTKLQSYFDDFNAGPRFWPNTHNALSVGDAPQVAERDFDENLELALHVVKGTSITLREAWTMPVGMLKWCSTGISKLGGADIQIWTPEHEEMFEAHKKRREAQIDERGKVIATEKGLPFAEARQQAHDEYWANVKQGLSNADRK